MIKDKSHKSDNELLREISHKLSLLIAMNGISDLTKNDQIKYLANFGFTIPEIGKLTGLPEGTVGRIKAEQKKKK